MLKKLRGPVFEDGTKVLARKTGLHYARPFRPYLSIVSAEGHPWGGFKEEECHEHRYLFPKVWSRSHRLEVARGEAGRTVRCEMCWGQWRWTEADSVFKPKWAGLAAGGDVQEKEQSGMSSGFLA